ncbi:MAG TPA: lactamase [Anaerolineae bacterium]|nr:MBL fold metallo-hydrolase [Caldilineae bacterium]HID35151.1 lactamase [Anaerolineae bacterium]HIQ12404.1 lactamase [Caldilineales bacterium]
MEITWYGLACFRFKSRQLTIVADPYSPEVGLTLPNLRARVVTISHDAPGHHYLKGVKGYEHVFDGPGEYEVNGVFITGVATYHRGKRGERERNTAFLYEFDDLSIGHLGDLGATLDRKQIEAMNSPDVLIAPVGGGSILDASQAVEIITELEPRIVIPMHYAQPGLKLELDPLEKFLKEMGVEATEPEPVLKLRKSDLTGDETRVVLLESQGAPA